ncbi:PREDICTED: cytosolic sulfotransferase 8-like [Nelumbo nucifera]|uniref:Sulfotransferase n=1 Tax=Nelumbo nucifera TaxID=4432 RepID=A0A1U8AX05_NELNU|nr:PREDICTED: cytosolic sulfotransferase 8-like [Nelumbo nucifera]XP_010272736.1 PREDICTED: cytosolic sulfotransferase 8-like [Nelumbo nucifera]
MEFTPPSKRCLPTKSKEEEEDDERVYQTYRNLISTLPTENGWSSSNLVLYQGSRYVPNNFLQGVMAVQQHFKARPTDILLTAIPKSGTTWMKALIFSIVNRTHYDFTTHPLLTHNPQDCVPTLETNLYRKTSITNPDLLPSPRLFSTHISCSSLPKSIIDSSCQIVYICRNPKDVLVSNRYFGNKIRAKFNKDQPLLSLAEAFQLFCKGASPFGPYWEHVLGFWKASLEQPERILFLKYEDLRSNPLVYLRKLAQHLGYPFSLEEEKQGVLEKILNLCSFQNLSNLEVNKNPDKVSHVGVEYSAFFRKGQVGDWKNHLTADMIEHIDRITEQKFHGCDFSF